MILFTSPKKFQAVGAYKMILSQKTFVCFPDSLCHIDFRLSRKWERYYIIPDFNTTDYFPSDDPFFLLLLTKEK